MRGHERKARRPLAARCSRSFADGPHVPVAAGYESYRRQQLAHRVLRSMGRDAVLTCGSDRCAPDAFLGRLAAFSPAPAVLPFPFRRRPHRRSRSGGLARLDGERDPVIVQGCRADGVDPPVEHLGPTGARASSPAPPGERDGWPRARSGQPVPAATAGRLLAAPRDATADALAPATEHAGADPELGEAHPLPGRGALSCVEARAGKPRSRGSVWLQRVSYNPSFWCSGDSSATNTKAGAAAEVLVSVSGR
jgi:hypothetical protein